MTAAAANDDLRYPIGDLNRGIVITKEIRTEMIQAVRELPVKVREAVAGLGDSQLDTPYRPEGWTVRQTVHHLADSHINSLCRFKLAMTEVNPTIRPYFEDRWAELADSRLPIEASLQILDAVHIRWTALLESFSDEDFQRTLVHPDSGQWTVDEFLGLYSWHGLHHTAHITKLRERMRW